MQVINFSHPMTQEQLDALGDAEIAVTNVKVQLDMNAALVPQVVELVNQVGFSAEEWQTRQFALRLPGLTDCAAIIIAEIHGRAGYFPRIVQITQTNGVFATRDVIDLQGVRNAARNRR